MEPVYVNCRIVSIVRGSEGWVWRVESDNVQSNTGDNVGWGLVTCKESPSYNLSQ